MAVSFGRQTLHFPRRFAPNQILSSFRLCVMDVFKLRVFCLLGTMVLCNGFRIMRWRETWYSRLLCPMWLQDVDWKGHLQVFIGGAVGRYWVTSGKLLEQDQGKWLFSWIACHQIFGKKQCGLAHLQVFSLQAPSWDDKGVSMSKCTQRPFLWILALFLLWCWNDLTKS